MPYQTTEHERAEMAKLPLLDYAQWMLDHGYYDVDVHTGTVTNARTGQELKWITGSDGYPYVELVFSQRIHRPLRVHRLVALKAWGIEAVRGKQVAHLDGSRDRSWLSNLRLMTAREHILHDGISNLPPPQPKAVWPACVGCGDPDGPIDKAGWTPTRISGRRFGIDGQLCRRCYKVLECRRAADARGAKPRIRRSLAVIGAGRSAA